MAGPYFFKRLVYLYYIKGLERLLGYSKLVFYSVKEYIKNIIENGG